MGSHIIRNWNEIYICEAVCEAVRKKTREQKSRTVTWQSADFQTAFFLRSNQVGADATAGRLSNNCFPRYQTIRRIFEKSCWTVTRQWLRSRDRRPTVKQRFWMFQAIRKIFEKSPRYQAIGRIFEKSCWTVTRQWLRSRDRRPTVKQRFWMFQAIRKIFEQSHWTVTRQWSEVTRPSADCQTTFFDVSSKWENFWKKSLNGHVTVVGGHATVKRLSNNVFWSFQAIWENFE